jgi:acyl carrier protein
MKSVIDSINFVLKQFNSQLDYSESANLRENFNFDSLEVIKFLLELENELNIEIPEEDIDAFELMNLGKLNAYLSNKIKQ